MKGGAWFIFALLLAVPLAAQSDCTDYTPPLNVIGFPQQTNSQYHVTGYHYYSSQATISCIYSDPPTDADQSCSTQLSVDMGISGGDKGTTTSAYHVNHVAENQAAAGNPDGGSSATGQAAIAFESCTTTSCGFNVSVGPITFPSASIWNGSQNYTGNCPAEHNPNACIPKGGSGNSPDEPICGGVSPIIVDTTGHGFNLTSADKGVVFDIEGDGHPIKLAWTATGSSNAFLALPHNGKITNGKELFGNYTNQPPCPDGVIDNCNGYRALAEFDKKENGGNEDGIIDSRDAVFSQLRLWIDTNHDGIAQPDEIHTLPELGVYSIGLMYRNDRYHDPYGNWFHYRAALNPDRSDGTSKDGRTTYDVFFARASTQNK